MWVKLVLVKNDLTSCRASYGVVKGGEEACGDASQALFKIRRLRRDDCCFVACCFGLRKIG